MADTIESRQSTPGGVSRHFARVAATALVFVVGLVAVDQLAGAVLRGLFERTEAGESGGVINHALAQTDADVVVFGSSRAAHHVDPDVLEEVLGLDVYNAGVNGQGIVYASMLQALMLSDGASPSVFVLQCEPQELFVPEPQRGLIMTPFARRDPVVMDILERIDPWIRVKLLSASYPFNSKLPGILRNQGTDADEDGFVTLSGRLDSSPVPASRIEAGLDPTAPLDPLVSDLYATFLDAADDAGVEVLMFTGPRYRVGGDGPAYARATAFFAELADERDHARFVALDETELPELLDGAWFSDVNHLNGDGAALFSRRLAERVDETLRH